MANQSESKKALKIEKIETKLEKIVLVIGTTGTGKSTLTNMLYNDCFRKKDLLKPCYTASTSDSATKNNNLLLDAKKKILYGDSVGLGDPIQSSEEIAMNLKNLIRVIQSATTGGVHCIIIMMKHGCRVTSEDRRNLIMLTKIFEEGWVKNCILVANFYDGDVNKETGVIDEKDHQSKINNWIGEDNDMKKLIDAIKGNVILTNLSSENHEELYRRLREQTLTKLKNFMDKCTDLVGASLDKKVQRDLIDLLLKNKGIILGAVFGAVISGGNTVLLTLGNSVIGGLIGGGVQAVSETSKAAEAREKEESKRKKEIMTLLDQLGDMRVRAGECISCYLEIFLPNMAQTKCNHIFHIECISEWFKKKDECPICRGKIKKVVQPVYFELK